MTGGARHEVYPVCLWCLCIALSCFVRGLFYCLQRGGFHTARSVWLGVSFLPGLAVLHHIVPLD